ncbi:uncharacterized protein BDR25DRAFT_309384 [Lindgomyces ingoldianus]|uniref:Uncharacterized protein n=1 Tax=Lindgomyces ingoldianus TaxID=673940 RepID=A0ACB6RCL7_9PLEO|nr:uncharacterized protein BDR25DRAFT_309384 [Lindgomyces ingoldianus]KAF2477078.1 hypothetical protein BDR25DRAFT_309384 [Lindgomyces ingoldianus]
MSGVHFLNDVLVRNEDHDNYLDGKAHKAASDKNYDDQAMIAARMQPDPETEWPPYQVYITISAQILRKPYSGRDDQKWNYDKELDNSGLLPTWRKDGEDSARSYITNEEPRMEFPDRMHKMTLMRFSGLANEYFTFNPKEGVLPLPVRYPRQHIMGEVLPGYRDEKHYSNPHMAYIHRKTVAERIIPWFLEAAKVKPPKKPKHFDIPDNLMDKIHLYNAMLQLGMDQWLIRPLTQALCEQMFQTDLVNCHLDVLEATICRLYSQGLPILDPVVNHLIGTYALRTPEDRRNVRDQLEYKRENAQRPNFPEDERLVPPQLPLLGHCIKHWSGVLEDDTISAAHLGNPLNVGVVYHRYDRPYPGQQS